MKNVMASIVLLALCISAEAVPVPLTVRGTSNVLLNNPAFAGNDFSNSNEIELTVLIDTDSPRSLSLNIGGRFRVVRYDDAADITMKIGGVTVFTEDAFINYRDGIRLGGDEFRVTQAPEASFEFLMGDPGHSIDTVLPFLAFSGPRGSVTTNLDIDNAASLPNVSLRLSFEDSRFTGPPILSNLPSFLVNVTSVEVGHAVPEPATASLTLFAAGGLLLRRRRNNQLG